MSIVGRVGTRKTNMNILDYNYVCILTSPEYHGGY